MALKKTVNRTFFHDLLDDGGHAGADRFRGAARKRIISPL
jgi:hypothetical protein